MVMVMVLSSLVVLLILILGPMLMLMLMLIRRLCVRVVAWVRSVVFIFLRRILGGSRLGDVRLVMMMLMRRLMTMGWCLRQRTGILSGLLARPMCRRGRRGVCVRCGRLETRGGYNERVKPVLFDLWRLLLFLTRHVRCSKLFRRRHVCICVDIVLIPLGTRQLCVEIAIKVGPMITKRWVQGCQAGDGWVR